MPDWSAVRAAYEAGVLPVNDICKSQSVTVSALYARRKREGWKPRYVSHLSEGKGTTLSSPISEESNVLATGEVVLARKALEAGNADGAGELIERLYAAYESKLAEFERIREESEREAVLEKDARTLGTFTRTLEKLIELKHEYENMRAKDVEAVASQEDRAVDIDELRQKIADRLARLHGGRSPSTKVGGADA